jgi:hypothetical protein
MVGMTSCTECQADLDDVPVGAICPVCGGHKRTVELTVAIAGVASVEVAANQPHVLVRDDDDRPWAEKWASVQFRLKELRAAYASDVTLETVDLRLRATSFYDECNVLRDWLGNDKALPTSTRSKAWNYRNSNKALATCRDLCDSGKHLMRDGGTTARIRSTDSFPPRVRVEINWASPNATTKDALDLAEDCFQAWRDFFKQVGITEP